MIVTNVLLFIISLFLLVYGSEKFVRSGSKLAKLLGVSEFLIGLTFVAIGTSFPELISSIFASLKGESGIIIGNVIGSNIANIAVILGISSLFGTIIIKRFMIDRDAYIMLFVSLLFMIFALNYTISRLEAGFLLILFMAYILFLFEESIVEKTSINQFVSYFFRFRYLVSIKNLFQKDTVDGKQKKEKRVLKFEKDFFISIIVSILSLIAIVYGANLLIDQTIFFANLLQVPTNLIALSVIALGTSLPELSVSISAIKYKYRDIAVGNIIGSNITNLLLVLGVSGLIHPVTLIQSTLIRTGPFMILLSGLLIMFMKRDLKLEKFEGIVFLILYLIFIFLLFYSFI